jgi:phosphatidylglycerol:prolipoprotein diacylglycerol transferase
MYPWLFPELFGYTVPLYDVSIIVGVFLMLLYVMKRFETRDGYSHKQVNVLLILIIVSLFFALFTSWVFDGIFHTIQEGEVSFGSITFIGGLMGGIGLFILLYHFFFRYDNRDLRKIMNTIITGVVLAHAFGRIGCFFAGCCFGIPTESFLGVVFPHGHASDMYPNLAVYPTQLFESAFLFALFFVLQHVSLFKNKEIEVYLIAYSVWRFMIEFIRGDDRGQLFSWFETEYNVYPTPSQFLSVLMLVAGIYLYIRWNRKKQTDES